MTNRQRQTETEQKKKQTTTKQTTTEKTLPISPHPRCTHHTTHNQHIRANTNQHHTQIESIARAYDPSSQRGMTIPKQKNIHTPITQHPHTPAPQRPNIQQGLPIPVFTHKPTPIQQAPTGETPMSEENKSSTTPPDIRLTKRDLSVLHFIGQQGIARQDTIRVLLEQGKPDTRPTHLHKAENPTGELSKDNTKRIIRRWKKLGLISSRKPYYDEPVYYWLSDEGLKQLGLPYKEKQPSLVTLSHKHQVNNVRVWLEGQSKDKIHIHQWQSERWLRHQIGAIHERKKKLTDKKEHTPDAIVECEIYTGQWVRQTIAIEVELTEKKEQRLQDIITWLHAHPNHTSVWYFVNEQTRGNVIKHVKDRNKFIVYDVNTFQRLHPL